MKKQFLFLLAGLVIVMIACTSNSSTEETATDSTSVTEVATLTIDSCSVDSTKACCDTLK